MPKIIAAFAQALDNRSVDHVFKDGQQLSPSATLDREKASSLISSVTSDGRKVFESDGVEIYCSGPLYVVEVIPEEQDIAGRRAPISMCIDLSGCDQGSDVAVDLVELVHSIGRTIDPLRAGLVNKALAEELKKKRPMGCLFPFL